MLPERTLSDSLDDCFNGDRFVVVLSLFSVVVVVVVVVVVAVAVAVALVVVMVVVTLALVVGVFGNDESDVIILLLMRLFDNDDSSCRFVSSIAVISLLLSTS